MNKKKKINIIKRFFNYINKIVKNFKITIYFKNGKRKTYKCNNYKWNYEEKDKKWFIISLSDPNGNIFEKSYIQIDWEEITSFKVKKKKKINIVERWVDYTKSVNNELLEEDFNDDCSYF